MATKNVTAKSGAKKAATKSTPKRAAAKDAAKGVAKKPSASAKSEPKTKATTVSFDDWLATVDATRRGDAEKLGRWMRDWTGFEAVVWGSNIVGFGKYSVSNGRGGANDWPITAFSPRAANFTLYLMDGFEGKDALLGRLGPHKTAKACLYLKGLAGVDEAALKELIQSSVAVMKKRYPAER